MHVHNKRNVSCHYCGRKGHVMDDCIVLKNNELDACKHTNTLQNKFVKMPDKNISNAYYYYGKKGHYMHNYYLKKQEDQNYRNSYAKKHGKKSQNQRVNCFNCGRFRHVISDYWFLRDSKIYPAHMNHFAFRRVQNPVFMYKRPSCNKCGRLGHITFNCSWNNWRASMWGVTHPIGPKNPWGPKLFK